MDRLTKLHIRVVQSSSKIPMKTLLFIYLCLFFKYVVGSSSSPLYKKKNWLKIYKSSLFWMKTLWNTERIYYMAGSAPLWFCQNKTSWRSKLKCWRVLHNSGFVYYRHITIAVNNTQVSALQWTQSTEISRIQAIKEQHFYLVQERVVGVDFYEEILLAGTGVDLNRNELQFQLYLPKSFLVLCWSGITLSHSSNV